MPKYSRMVYDGDREEIVRLIKNMYPNASTICFQYTRLPEPRFMHFDTGEVTIAHAKKGVNTKNDICYVGHPNGRERIRCIDVNDRDTVVGMDDFTKAYFDPNKDAIMLPVVWFVDDNKADNGNGVLKLKIENMILLSASTHHFDDLDMHNDEAKGIIEALHQATGCETIVGELELVLETLSSDAPISKVINIWKKCHKYCWFDYIGEYSRMIADTDEWRINKDAENFFEAFDIAPEFAFAVNNANYEAFKKSINNSRRVSSAIVGYDSKAYRFIEKLSNECKSVFLYSAEIGRFSLQSACADVLDTVMMEASDYAYKYPQFFCSMIRNPSMYGLKDSPLETFVDLCKRFEVHNLIPSMKGVSRLQDEDVAELHSMDYQEFVDLMTNLNTRDGLLKAIDTFG